MFQQAKPNPFALPPQQLGIEPTQFNIPAPKPGGGMFGGGGKKVLATIAEALAAYSAGMGNPAGMAVLQGMNHRRQSAADAETQEQQYQRRQADAWSMWQRQQDYENANRPPSEMQRLAMEAGIQPGSPEYIAGMKAAFQNRTNPFVAVTRQNPDGSEVREFMRPPQAPTAPVGGLVPIDDEEEGGPRPLGVGGFPGSF